MTYEVGSALWYRNQINTMPKMNFEDETTFRFATMNECNKRVKNSLSVGMEVQLQVLQSWEDTKGKRFKGVVNTIGHLYDLPNHVYIVLQQKKRSISIYTTSIQEISILSTTEVPIQLASFTYDFSTRKFTN